MTVPTRRLNIRHPLKRWAAAIVQAVDLPQDPKTVSYWCRSIGVSETQLRVTCRMVGLGAKTSLDFARLLRAVIQHEQGGWPIADYLDLSEPRTLSRLLTRAGMQSHLPPAGVEAFLMSQQLVSNGDALNEIRDYFLTKPKAVRC